MIKTTTRFPALTWIALAITATAAASSRPTSRSRSSDLHEAVWWSLKEAGIVIAFPQLDVHLDDNVVDAAARKK